MIKFIIAYFYLCNLAMLYCGVCHIDHSVVTNSNGKEGLTEREAGIAPDCKLNLDSN